MMMKKTKKTARMINWMLVQTVEWCILNNLRKRMEKRMRYAEKQAKFLERYGSCVGEIRVWKKCEPLPEAEQAKKLLQYFGEYDHEANT